MYRHFGKAIVRTPLLDYNELLASDDDKTVLTTLLHKKLNDPVFLETLYWASPDIFQLAQDLKNGLIKSEKKKSRLIVTLKKYIIRAGSRSTPFGIFAGCGLTDTAKTATGGEIPLEKVMYRKIRIDTALLHSIIEHIKTNSEIRSVLNYRTNSSLYLIHGSYRYMEYQLKDGERDYQLNAVAQSPELERLVAESCDRALDVASMMLLIGDENEEQEKASFIDELIDMQFLVTELELSVTTEDQLGRLKSQLTAIEKHCPAVEPYLALISHIETVCSYFERCAIGTVPVAEINALRKQIEAMDIPVHRQILFHADLYKSDSKEIVISEDMIEALLKATKVLSMFSPRKSANEELLKRFKAAFTEKYETQEIPLTEVTDMEAGIGFPVTEHIGNICYNPLTTQIKTADKTEILRHKYKWHNFLQQRIQQAVSEGEKGILLSDHDLQSFDDKTPMLANTISLLFSVLPGGQLLLHSAGGATANSLLARFAYLEEGIENLVQAISSKDMALSGDAILAEIVHLPDGRVGNVIRRAAIGSYEIPFLTSAGMENQIPSDDLMVSVQNNQILLRSKKLNKRIIPRLSCAHNFRSSELSVYQFLSAMQYQAQPSLEMNLGGWAADSKFTPRISYGRVILKLASWYFTPADYTFILNSSDPQYALSQFLRQWGLPVQIALGEGDNELFIDTRDIDYLHILLEELRKKKPVKLIEWLHFGEGKSSANKVPANQYILPLYRTIPENGFAVPYRRQDKNNPIVSRTFAPGSEWIYLKIYCSAYLSDELLSHSLHELSTRLYGEQMIDQFFFIRYTDPHYHIRYRMHLKDHSAVAWGEVMTAVNLALQDLLDSRAIWKIQLDTYSREIERYGTAHIEPTEELFFRDSMVYLNFTKQESFIANENLRLLTAIKNIDKWLTLFKLELHEKISFSSQMSAALAKEFGNDAKAKADAEYREMKKDIAYFMIQPEFDEIYEIRNQTTFADLPRENLPSYIHMSINRWFKTEQRLMEFICYNFCSKYYQMQAHYHTLLQAEKN